MKPRQVHQILPFPKGSGLGLSPGKLQESLWHSWMAGISPWHQTRHSGDSFYHLEVSGFLLLPGRDPWHLEETGDLGNRPATF